MNSNLVTLREYVERSDKMLQALVAHGHVPRHYRRTNATIAELHTAAQQLLASPNETPDRQSDGMSYWEIGIRNIVTALGWKRRMFEVSEVVEEVERRVRSADDTSENPNVSPTMLRCLAADIHHNVPILRERGYVDVLNACAEVLERRTAAGKGVDSQEVDEPSGPNP